MKIIHIRGDQFNGGDDVIDVEDYYTLLSQPPDCMYFFIDSSIPVKFHKMKPINRESISYESLRGITAGNVYTTYGSIEGIIDFELWEVYWNIKNSVSG